MLQVQAKPGKLPGIKEESSGIERIYIYAFITLNTLKKQALLFFRSDIWGDA